MNRKVIFIFLLLLPALAYGNAGSRFHRVRQGDSLSQIANRYGITVNAIKAWNKIQGSSIHPGRLLKVGVRKKAPPRRRRWKKIAPLKEERSIKIIGPTFVTLPYNYSPPPAQLQEHRDDLFTLRVYAADFRQGNAAYLEIMPAARSMSLPRITFNKQNIPLTATSFGYRALFGFAPEMRTGLNWLVISFQHNGSAKIRRYPMIVKPTSYQSFTRRVYLGDLSKPPRQLSAEELEKRRQAWKERQEKIARATAKKNAVYSRLSIDYLQNRLSHPRGLHKITSPFYVNRTIARYFKKHGRIFHKNPASIRHRGLDLRGRYGKPIYAVADGIVAIAEHMVFEGNFVVIDHGKGVFTGYMHQSKLLVSEGQRVQAGQLLGNSGNTGASAGPHLHLALFMRGTYYEPLSLLSLPIRN